MIRIAEPSGRNFGPGLRNSPWNKLLAEYSERGEDFPRANSLANRVREPLVGRPARESWAGRPSHVGAAVQYPIRSQGRENLDGVLAGNM